MYEKGGLNVKEASKFAQTSGTRCKQYRKKAGMTQAKLAEEINCSVDLISAIERGSRSLTVKNAEAMSKVLGVRKEFLLCFDDFETDGEKNTTPYIETTTVLQAKKEAFSLYAGICGYNIALVDNSNYKNLSPNAFISMSPQQQAETVIGISSELGAIHYSLQTKEGVEVFRCNATEFTSIVEEIAEFAEFKIKKLIEGSRADG